MRRPIYFVIALTLLCLASTAFSVHNTNSAQRTIGEPADMIGMQISQHDAGKAIAEIKEPQSPQQKNPKENCTRELDLTGQFNGLVYTDKNQKAGEFATINVKGATFELASSKFKASGIISGVNTCGDASIALKFTTVTDSTEPLVSDLLNSGVSLEARVVKGDDKWVSLESVTSDKAVVLATAKDKDGNYAGPDVAFLLCPEHPSCKRYPTCPCPEPTPQASKP